MMVGCNVGMNVFLMKLFANADITAVMKSDTVSWPTAILQILGVECLVIVVALALAVVFQTRKRDLV